MKIFKNIFFALFYFTTYLQMELLADIIQIDNLNEANPAFHRLDNNSLVLIDVDYTLLIPNDAILRPCGQDLVEKLAIEILESPSIVPPENNLVGYLLSQRLLQGKSSVVEEQFLSLIEWLQSKKIRTIAFTAAPAGKLGVIDNMADWRIDQLKKFGFDFTMAFPEIQFLEFPKRSDKKFHPTFKSGVLFSSKHSKGAVLKQFLDAIQWSPTKVVFIDDRFDFLESVEDVMEEMGIDFTGFHYIAAEKIPCELDENLAKFQFEYLAKHAEWLSDEEAKNMMKNKR